MNPKLPASLILCFAAAATATAQQPIGKKPPRPEVSRPKVHNKAANKQIKLLELSSRKSDAVAKLLAMGPKAAKDLGQALSDPRLEIVQTVAHILRILGPDAKDGLPALQRLAKCDDEKRARIAKWALARVAPRGKGTILISASKGGITELDDKGKETWSLKQANSLFDAERLANGNYLVAVYTKKLVQEVTPKGKVVWKYTKAQTPMDADRLPNGNTLISDIRGKVIEVNPAGKIVWECATKSSYQAERLPNGHTLIPEFGGGRVKEVDAKGKVVWEYKCAQPMDADRLPNGNTLIAIYGGSVVEVTPKGKVVLRFKAKNPYAVTRLPNGDYLTVNNQGVVRYDAKGKQIWVNNLGMAGSVEVY